MPSYLSSTQTSGPSRRDDLGGVLGRRGEHELERVEERQLGARRARSSRASAASRPTSPTSMPGPLDVVERPVERLGDRRLDEPLAQADAQVAAEDLDDALGGQPGRTGRAARAGSPTCGAGPRPPRSPRTRRPPRERRAELGAAARGRRAASTSATAMPRSDERSYASPSADRGDAGDGRDGRGDRRPAEAGGALVGLGERPAGQEDGGDRQLVGRRGCRK